MQKKTPRTIATNMRSQADKDKADAFARAMTRNVFGNNYMTERDMEEIHRAGMRTKRKAPAVKR